MARMGKEKIGVLERRGEERMEKMRGRQGEVSRRRGRCSCLRCLCANNYPDEMHSEQHEFFVLWGIPHDTEKGRSKGYKYTVQQCRWIMHDATYCFSTVLCISPLYKDGLKVEPPSHI